MRYIFKFPDIGEGLEEGVIIQWHVDKGQKVKMGESLVTMETDKVVTEIPSPRDGVIAARYGSEGETIRVGAALVEIELDGDEVATNQVEDKPKAEAVEEEGAGVVGTLEVAGNDFVLTASKEGVSEEKETKSRQSKALATPVARAMAKEMGIDINLVRGTGPAQRVMKNDILNYSKQDSKPIVSKPLASDNLLEDRLEIEPLSQIRKTIAKNMIQSKHNAAHMTVFEEVEISELDRVRKKYKDYFKDENIRITYLAFIVKAVALALKKHKSLNAEMDMDKGVMIYKKYYNIGIAADTEKGLVVPVIKNADKLSVKEIALEIQVLADKARDGKLSMDDMKDGTFTITSYGSIGGLFLAEEKQRLDAVTNKIVESVKVNYQRFLKNQERIAVLKDYVVANENIVEVYKSEFESGTRTFVDILDAQTVLYEAKKSLVLREFELYTNYYEILNTLSILTPTVLETNACSNDKALSKINPEQKRASFTINSASNKQKTTVAPELGAMFDDEKPAVKSNKKEDKKVADLLLSSDEKPTKKEVKSEYSSFLDAPADYYTINITTTNGLDAAKNYVSSNNLGTDAYTYSFDPQMKSAKVIYGTFKSMKDAQEAMDNLPASVISNKPYIDKISKHQKLYSKYNN
jgi:pyruvate dehydrogenase E2 component (dihydrolipoamide acetyltransferase)